VINVELFGTEFETSLQLEVSALSEFKGKAREVPTHREHAKGELGIETQHEINSIAPSMPSATTLEKRSHSNNDSELVRCEHGSEAPHSCWCAVAGNAKFS